MPQWLSSVLPLPGAPYATTFLPSRAAADEELHEVVADLRHRAGEAVVTLERVQTGGGLGGEHVGDRLGGRTGALGRHRPGAQRPAVAGQLLDVDHGESGRGEHPLRGQQRQVGEVLVVDRVVLVALDQLRSKLVHREDFSMQSWPLLSENRRENRRCTESAAQ